MDTDLGKYSNVIVIELEWWYGSALIEYDEMCKQRQEFPASNEISMAS
jgi:hypothetical protein